MNTKTISKGEDEDRNKEMPVPSLDKAYLRSHISYLPRRESFDSFTGAAFFSRCYTPTPDHFRLSSNNAMML